MDPAAGPKKIGLIGLGLMGRPMGMNLIKAGYALTVWNRTASRADELVAAGARLAKSPQEVAAACDFLLTIVSDPPALEEVLWAPSGAVVRGGGAMARQGARLGRRPAPRAATRQCRAPRAPHGDRDEPDTSPRDAPTNVPIVC